jgi:SAM-dependent methyltransferase
VLKLSPGCAKDSAMKARFTMAENRCTLRLAPGFPPAPTWLPDDATIARHFGKSLVYSEYKVILTKRLAALFPPGPLSILDVGAGDGLLGGFFQKYRPKTAVTGLETLIRVDHPPIDLISCDGSELPFEDASWDVILFANVLHHTKSQAELIKEAVRVGRRQILIKDHVYRSWLGCLQLRLLDLLGNLRFGVATTADYLQHGQWESLFSEAQIGQAWEYPGIPLRRGLMRLAFSNDLEVIFDIPLNDD